MNWPFAKFSEVANIVTGATPSKSREEYYGGTTPWVRPPELGTSIPISTTAITLTEEGSQKARLIPKNAVMVCCIGSIGKVGIAGKELATNQQINSLIFCDKLHPKFGFFYCLHQAEHFRSTAPSAVVPIINKTNFSSFEIPVPPLAEQNRIVEILDQADTLRLQRRQADQISQKIIPALFHEMFGTLPLCDQGLEDKLDFLTSGSRGWASHYSSSGPVFIRIQNVKNLKLTLDDVAYVTPPATKEAERTKVRPRDVLLSITADLGRTCVIPDEFEDGFINQHLAILRTSKLNPYFLAAYLASPEGLNQLGRLNRSAVKAGLNFNDIRSVKLPNAPKKLQDRFEERMKTAQLMQMASTTSTTTLETLFQTLLHRAFDGSLTAKWREAHANELLQEMETQSK